MGSRAQFEHQPDNVGVDRDRYAKMSGEPVLTDTRDYRPDRS